jgi:hypothetical protein
VLQVYGVHIIGKLGARMSLTTLSPNYSAREASSRQLELRHF